MSNEVQIKHSDADLAVGAMFATKVEDGVKSALRAVDDRVVFVPVTIAAYKSPWSVLWLTITYLGSLWVLGQVWVQAHTMAIATGNSFPVWLEMLLFGLVLTIITNAVREGWQVEEYRRQFWCISVRGGDAVIRMTDTRHQGEKVPPNG